MTRQKFSFFRTSIASVCLLWLGFLPTQAFALPEQAIVHAAQPDLPEVAAGLPMGGALVVHGIDIEGETSDTLILSRFRVFAPDAEIVIDNAYSVSPPDTAYFRGTIEGDAESIAVLAVPESGDPEGLILGPKGIWKIEKQKSPAATALAARKLKDADLAALKEFRCGTDDLGLVPEAAQGDAKSSSTTAPDTEAAVISHTARVAVETDYEFYARFNNVDNASNYVGALFAYISSIYEAETSTSLYVSFLRFWTGGAGSDPWTATSSSAALGEFKSYWNTNETTRQRTIAHMLSGKSTGGGVAWLSVLCASYQSPTSGLGYGFSGNLTRATVVTTQTVWDTMVVAHEIGHNFGSHHTHCYAGYHGEFSDVDRCYGSEDGCYNGSTSLPGVDSLTGGTSGAGNGTIMSYCHLLGGGYGNVTMTFGLTHPFGVDAFRVPQRMSAHVQSRAQSYPACLAPIVDSYLLEITKAGTGSGTVTSNPSGISCGSDCSEYYPPSTVIGLTSTPDTGSSFSNWTGSCSGTNPSTSVTMDAAKTCTATFNIQQYQLTVTKSGAGTGTVTSSPAGINCGSDCSESYAPNTVVQLTASPDTGSSFSNWSGSCSGTSTTTSVTMNAAKICTAVFESQLRLLTITRTGTGTGTVTSNPSGIDCGSDCAEYYQVGTNVDLTATSDADSSFSGWSGSCSETKPSTSVTMDAAKTCTATFTSLCGNGVCDGGNENCSTCPQDCAGGSYGGAVCGNGMCETADGENCLTCAADCAGKTGGRPSGRFCCGDSDGMFPSGCADSSCDSGGYACTTTPASEGGTYCCGDNHCEGPEDASFCQVDCGTPPPPPSCGDGFCNGVETACDCPNDCGLPLTSESGLCSDGENNDLCYDNLADCADPDCSEDPACQSSCLAAGEQCSANSECCSSNCHPNKKVCR